MGTNGNSFQTASKRATQKWCIECKFIFLRCDVINDAVSNALRSQILRVIQSRYANFGHNICFQCINSKVLRLKFIQKTIRIESWVRHIIRSTIHRY